MNLFATLTEVLNPDVLTRIAAYIDEPTEKTNRAVNGLVYTIVGGLMKRTTTEIGVNQLFNHIQKGRYDGSLTDNLANVLKDATQTYALINQGDEVISHLLPAMKSSIGSMISSYAGIRNSSAISLLGLTSSIVLHVLGKQVKDKKLDADGLASSLFAERDAFVTTVPEDFLPRLVEKVGLQQIMSGLAVPARRNTAEAPGRSFATTSSPASRSTTTVTRPSINYDPVDDSDTDSGALTKWGMGLLIAGLLAVVIYYVYQNTINHSSTSEQASDVTTITGDTIQADTVTRSLAVPIDTTAKPKPKATIPVATTAALAAQPGALAGNLTQQMTPYLSNPALPKGRAFPLAGLAYYPGSLSMTAGSQAVVGELATLLKTHPQLQIQLVGYANDAQRGITNKSLSFKRVNQIKQQLMTSGIDFLRIDALGRGTGVARNDTSAVPKPTLRKIIVKVVVK
ncbi:DUF937 domain-containing protein [Spirosoma agri]|uniref:DUF937 domain-containing protein n=1 Tax=Spirosoma agri TaxID=1987381 RepID=A0A6M0IS18_9BACT|nr:DUF937 domain-containing protein [Spirosoma agri]NEU69793.1 DUF937 domain-containing protein [Spirosoma agri]